MSEGTQEKKIVVDEDWKARVEAERQQAAEEARQRASQAAAGTAETDDELLPPPGLLYLVSTMYFQSLVCLGQLPHPASGKAEPNLRRARHAIDTLEILFEKTQGNRTADETQAFESILHELRLAYLNAMGGSG